MKKQLLLLVSMLLPLISSCNQNLINEPTYESTIEPTVETTKVQTEIPTFETTIEQTIESTKEPTVEPEGPTITATSETTDEPTNELSAEIYYVDGLPSNLFVYDYVEELFNFTFIEEMDCYSIELSYLKDTNISYDTITIPNIFDDGTNGLKRIKYAGVNGMYESDNNTMTINNIFISEGIISLGLFDTSSKRWFYKPITKFNCKNLYVPLSLKQISSIIGYPGYFKRMIDNEYKIHYPETIKYFYENCEFINKITDEHYKLDYEIEISCTDGSIMFETYDYKIF